MGICHTRTGERRLDMKWLTWVRRCTRQLNPAPLSWSIRIASAIVMSQSSSFPVAMSPSFMRPRAIDGLPMTAYQAQADARNAYTLVGGVPFGCWIGPRHRSGGRAEQRTRFESCAAGPSRDHVQQMAGGLVGACRSSRGARAARLLEVHTAVVDRSALLSLVRLRRQGTFRVQQRGKFRRREQSECQLPAQPDGAACRSECGWAAQGVRPAPERLRAVEADA